EDVRAQIRRRRARGALDGAGAAASRGASAHAEDAPRRRAVRPHRRPARRGARPSQMMTSLTESFRGKRILIVGATGFVGKVALAMLLDRFPDVGQVFVLVRPGAGSSSEERFFGQVVKSPVVDPIRSRYGGPAGLRPAGGEAKRSPLNDGGPAGLRPAGGEAKRSPLNEGTEAFLRTRCAPLPGDAARADLNFSAEDLARLG